MIGSREAPQHILDLMIKLASKLAKQGWIGRSGGANGADQCLEDGVCGILSSKVEIYLPWEGFNNKSCDNRGYINTPRLKNYTQAALIAENTHPNWAACSRGARALHTRNVYQLLGLDLNTPSKFVVCWAKPTGDGDNVKGGTGTAVRLGINYGVEIRNLYNKDVLDKVIKYLKED